MPLPRSLMLIAGIAMVTSACGRSPESTADQAQTVSDWSTLKDFTAVDATGPDNVAITVGNGFSVKPEGDPKAIGKLDIRIENGELKIGRKPGMSGLLESDKGATVRVTMPAVQALSLTGTGEMTLDRAEGKALDLSLTGTGELKIAAVKLDALRVELTGSGDVELAGTVADANVSTTGTGSVDAERLKAGKADISVQGTGDVDLASDGPVAISIMGTGDVTVKGKAQCTTKRMGTGEAHCAP
ncbi:head GIN domain-containing protein [Sphingobium estronivorans]|uniref:head GIN domain-containing protein n=1 Tax=Sphingobium estronivorans TaxID=1577690 RepID=UPI00123B3D73|nr:head GIN domain-containing protein [Sphingobium estronivorans]